MKRNFLLYILFILGGASRLASQDIVTAERYLSMVAERYGGIRDYEADITIHSGSSDMTGVICHLAPSFLRIDFSKPAGQVIAFSGDQITVYLPEYRAVLNQSVSGGRGASGAGLASAQGLLLMRRGYIPSFVSGPNPEPMSGTTENVVRLRLVRRSASEGFRELILSIEPQTLLILRIEGRTIADASVRFDFSNIRTNQGIPEQRFIYESPASANVYNNFLFRDD